MFFQARTHRRRQSAPIEFGLLYAARDRKRRSLDGLADPSLSKAFRWVI